MAISFCGPREALINKFTAQLTSAIDTVGLTLPVDDATGLPTADFYRVDVEGEIIRCRGRSGNNLTAVERGAEGTTAAAHGSGSYVSAKLTAGGLRRFLLEHTAPAFSEESITRTVPHNRCLDAAGTVLTASSFSWANQGTATLADHNGGLVMKVPAATGNSLRVAYVSSPSRPFRVYAKLSGAPGAILGEGVGNFGPFWGVLLRESGTGELLSFHVQERGFLTLGRWNSPTSYFGDIDNFSYYDGDSAWLMVEDNGTTTQGAIGRLGHDWSKRDSATIWQGTSDGFLTPDGCGIFVCANNSSHNPNTPFVFESFIIEQF